MKLQDGIAKFSRLASLGSQSRLERLIKINEIMQNVLAQRIQNKNIRLGKQRLDNLGMRPNETTTS